jgi:hypothetical protein
MTAPDLLAATNRISGPGLAQTLAAGIDHAQTRRVYLQAMGLRSRAACGLKVVLAIDALVACLEDGGSVNSARAYERWRASQPHCRELPSAHFIARAFDDRWSAALDAAGLPVTPGRRVQQLNPRTRGFAAEQVQQALARWLAEDPLLDPQYGQFRDRAKSGSVSRCGQSQRTFTSYLRWAYSELAKDPGLRLPLSAPTFRRYFGCWAVAVSFADQSLNTPAKASILELLSSAQRHGGVSERSLHQHADAMLSGIADGALDQFA